MRDILARGRVAAQGCHASGARDELDPDESCGALARRPGREPGYLARPGPCVVRDRMPRLLRSRLSVRLTALFLLAGLAPALAVGALTLEQLERSVRGDAEQRLDLLAGIVGDLLVDGVRGAEEKLQTVSRLLESELAEREVGAFTLENFSYRETVLARLEGLVEPAGAFLELQYFAAADDAGEDPPFVALAQQTALTAREAPGLPLRNVLNVEANQIAAIVQEPAQRGSPHRDLRFRRHEGFATLRLSRPIAEPAGGSEPASGTGALVGYVDFGAFAATLARLAGAELAIRVVDAEGTELAAAGAVAGDRIERAREVRPEPGAAPGDAWRVVVAESEEAVRAPVARLRRRLLPWFGAAALGAVLVSLAFSAWVTRPIERLRRTAEAMEAGDLAARAGVERADEIGALGRAFDAMAAALHRLDAAKSEFLGNVSHELRTPLTSLKLTVANVLDGVTGDVPPAQREALERVRRELARLSALVEDLLELARLEAGGAEPELTPVALADLARECADALAPTAERSGVALAVTGAGRALADAGMLRRVLWNLLDNAIQATPPGGGVRVQVADGRLAVADDGPGGVPADAFVRFRQGARAGAKPAGAGLGLAIVAQLVALLDGRVEVADGAERGAVFTVHLPRADRADGGVA
jgi:signal transduction histidine kinase